MRVVLNQLHEAATRLQAARADVERLTDRAFAAGATNRQIAEATGEKADTVRMRRRRRRARAAA